jgi:hypothetical protein
MTSFLLETACKTASANKEKGTFQSASVKGETQSQTLQPCTVEFSLNKISKPPNHRPFYDSIYNKRLHFAFAAEPFHECARDHQLCFCKWKASAT